MEYIWLVYLILAIVLLVYGLSQLFGFGWAMIIFDLFIAHSVSTDYADAQKSKPPARDQKTVILGLFCTLVGLVVGYYAIRGFF